MKSHVRAPASSAAPTASSTKRTSTASREQMRSRSMVRYFTFNAEHATTTRLVLWAAGAQSCAACAAAALASYLCSSRVAAAATRSSQGVRSLSVSARPLAMASVAV